MTQVLLWRGAQPAVGTVSPPISLDGYASFAVSRHTGWPQSGAFGNAAGDSDAGYHFQNIALEGSADGERWGDIEPNEAFRYNWGYPAYWRYVRVRVTGGLEWGAGPDRLSHSGGVLVTRLTAAELLADSRRQAIGEHVGVGAVPYAGPWVTGTEYLFTGLAHAIDLTWHHDVPYFPNNNAMAQVHLEGRTESGDWLGLYQWSLNWRYGGGGVFDYEPTKFRYRGSFPFTGYRLTARYRPAFEDDPIPLAMNVIIDRAKLYTHGGHGAYMANQLPGSLSARLSTPGIL